MSEIRQVRLAPSFDIRPEQLIVARKRVPVDGDFIPVFIPGKYPLAVPTFTALGGGAVEMSLGRPFGFRKAYGDDFSIIFGTQKTDGLIVAPDPDAEDKWLATFDTPEPLDLTDLGVFNYSIRYYAACAREALKNTEPPQPTPTS